MRRAFFGLAIAAACASCSNVLGIPNDTPSFCAQSANQGHDYCEDFDVGDATARWTFSEATGGATIAVEPGSDRSAPNLLDLSAPGIPSSGSSALAGYTVEFDSRTFTGLHIEADVRFVTPDGGPITTAGGGFLLVVDKSGGCVALGIAVPPSGSNAVIGAVTFPQSTGCSALTGSGGVGAISGPNTTPLTGAPPPNQWFHVIIEVLPDKVLGGGAGTLTFDVQGVPGSTPTVHLGTGTLVSSGIPLVGFAAEVYGPSGPLEVQYDDITVDVVDR